MLTLPLIMPAMTLSRMSEATTPMESPAALVLVLNMYHPVAGARLGITRRKNRLKVPFSKTMSNWLAMQMEL